MISDRILNPTVIAVISGLHALLLLGAWQATPPQLTLSTDSLSYVDLSGLSQAGTATTQPPTPPAQAQQKPKPKPPETAKPVLKPLIKPVPRNDVAAVKEQPKPQTQPTEPVKPATESKADSTPSKPGGTDGGAVTQGGGQGSGSSQNNGGNSGGAVVPPTHNGGHLGNPKPPYPALSRENGEEGRVGLRVQVSADGRAQSVAVVKGSGYPRLDRSAKNAVERYRFSPATRGGVPIAYSYTFSINFSLKER